jgi:hypothetical protein
MAMGLRGLFFCLEDREIHIVIENQQIEISDANLL